MDKNWAESELRRSTIKRATFVDLFEEVILGRRQDGFVGYNDKYSYIFVENGKGYNNTCVGYESLEPIICNNKENLKEAIGARKFSNGEGEFFEFVPTRESHYYNECIKDLDIYLDFLKKYIILEGNKNIEEK
jgi:hypothetical protein